MTHSLTTGADGFLYRFEAQLFVNPVGLVPEGLLMSNAFEGTITDGFMRGGRVSGVDQLLIRRDGISVIDAPKTLELDQRRVVELVRGYCIPPAGLNMPELEQLLAPGFQWPDVPFTIRGCSTFRVADAELSELSGGIARIDGTVSMATGKLVVETRLLSSL